MNAGEEPYKKRRTDERGQDAKRNLDGRYGARECVDEEKETAAKDRRGRDEAGEIRPYQGPRKVWDDETNPPNHAGGGDAG
jgi:hypothetical protein